MGTVFPPCSDPEQFQRELALIPKRLREEAIQEAWLACQQNTDPIQAIKTWARREVYQDGKTVALPTDDDGEVAGIESNYPQLQARAGDRPNRKSDSAAA